MTSIHDDDKLCLLDPCTSVWINASAGTGKTHALVSRILSLLLQNRRGILCMTFTKAAATEMQDRVFEKIMHWKTLTDEEIIKEISHFLPVSPTKNHLIAAKTLSELKLDITIDTIHSFCYKIISEFFKGEDYSLKIIEQTEQLRKKSAILALVDPSLEEDLNIVEKYIESRNYIFSILEELYGQNYSKYDIDLPELEIKNLEQTETNIDLESVIEILKTGTKKDISIANKLEILLNHEHWNIEKLSEIFLTLQNKPRSFTISNKMPTGLQCSMNNILEIALRYISLLTEKEIIESTTALLKIYNKFIDHYTIKKELMGVIDYNDIITKALHLLTKHEHKDTVLLKLISNFNHILIDESQDNTPTQWNIITTICEELNSYEDRTLFFVGDAKQSIYGFLNSSPELFEKMRNTFKSRNQNLKIINLNKSYRSAKNIINFINIMINAMSEHLPDHTYHITARPDHHQGYVEIWPKLSIDNQPKFNKSKQQALIAKTIVKKIKTTLSEKKFLRDKQRQVIPADIMLLFRKRGELMRLIGVELAENNIPFVSAYKDDNPIINDLISLGRFIVQPHDNGSLLNVLRSNLLNLRFSDEELVKIILREKKSTIWNAIKNEELTQIKKLRKLLELSINNSPYLLYKKIVSNHEYIDYLSYKFDINAFMDKLRTYEKNNTPSLVMFLEQFEHETSIIDNTISSQCIQIKTVHGSKGLQSPITFICDATSSRFPPSLITFSSGIPFWTKKYHKKFEDIRSVNKSQLFREYIRLFYVAMTRAEDELYILGEKIPNEGTNTWYDIIPDVFEKKTIDLTPIFEFPAEVRYIGKQ